MSQDPTVVEKSAETRAERHARQPSLVRRVIPIPGVMGRGRTTGRHFSGLLLGGYIAWGRDRRRRGARGLFYRVQAIIAGFCWLVVDHELVKEPFPVQMRRRLEILGPTYVKIGQIISSRARTLPVEWQVELELLQSDVALFPH